MRQRGFEVVSAYADKGIRLPQRKTAGSAGYDMEAAEAVILEPHRVTVIPTGLKAYMPADEYLGIHVRSGFSIRQMVSCVNDEGIIDADYYDNDDNEDMPLEWQFKYFTQAGQNKQSILQKIDRSKYQTIEFKLGNEFWRNSYIGFSLNNTY